jgi:glutamate formiminotransferase/glutamate formiminotransferase/formiminotetrahydrofolate cyclodeaminase
VPNFSEGRDAETIAALRAVLGEHARVLDVHVDADHNRSVFTICGDGVELTRALVGAVECARDRIDLRTHEGVHPRVGAADIVPIVAVWPEQMEQARKVADLVARQIDERLGLPVFLYGEDRGPAFFRRGGVAELQRRIDAGELTPDFGPARLDPCVGAVLVGARRPLIAFNVELRTDDVAVAREIAAVVREKGGGFPGVRALGLELPSRGIVQVSMNVEDPEAVALHDVVARIREEAAARGVEAGESELVGLLPASVAAQAARESLGLPGLDESRLLEVRLLDPHG